MKYCFFAIAGCVSVKYTGLVLSCFAAVQEEKSGTVLQGRSLSPDWKFSIEVGAWFLRGPGGPTPICCANHN